MSTPMRRPRPKALVPSPESLETRQLLSKTVTGTDIDGDKFTLKLQGPGDLRVIKQNDSTGNPAPLDSLTQIAMIEIAGGDPQSTRVIGQVTKAPQGNGKVFFQNLQEIGGRSERNGTGNGIQTIDIPGFWLANTNPSVTPANGAAAGSITIPDGVVTLRFGGADATIGAGQGTGTTAATTSNNLTISLGLPSTTGTSIIVDQVISGARPGTASSGSTATPVQDGVTFLVAGRLNLFQANSILGNAGFAPTGFQGGGGTIVVSTTETASAITGQIGDIRVGGNATNFGAQTNDRVSNFYIGGETNNVLLLAPSGSRNIYFGKGMDNVTILTHTFENLQANRGSLNSNVTVDRSAGRVVIGGDAVNTNILSGYQQSLGSVFSSQAAPTTPPNAQIGGGFTALVAGSVTNSVFAASVQPLNNTFGTPNDLKLPEGHIDAKIEGTIDNATATPDSPSTAFYAQGVHLQQGPVIPPIVPEAPFPRTVYHRGQHGLLGTRALAKMAHASSSTTPTTTAAAKTASPAAVRAASVGAANRRIGATVPHGPATAKSNSKGS